jgi:HemK-like putative methylase
MFAGSGCVGVAFAHHIPTSLVDFAEKEARHLATIKKNCEINAVSDDRMRLFQSNIFSDIPDGSTYDLILANPPYIDSEAPQSVASSVLGHEPHDALFSTGAGLDLIRSLLDTAPQYMRSGSEIWIEHGPTQAAQVRHLAEQCGFSARTMSDQYERDRVMIGILK